MRITVMAAHGLSLELDTEGQDFTPDGVDTLLRQVSEAYATLLATDIAQGVLTDTPVIEAHTEFGPGDPV